MIKTNPKVDGYCHSTFYKIGSLETCNLLVWTLENGKYRLQCTDTDLEFDFENYESLNDYINQNYIQSCCTYCS